VIERAYKKLALDALVIQREKIASNLFCTSKIYGIIFFHFYMKGLSLFHSI